MARRKTLIGISIAGHAALFAGVFVTSVWDVEQLDHDVRFRPNLGVITPPRLDSGQPATTTEPQKPRPKPPEKVKRLAQPTDRRPDPTPPPETSTVPGSGLGQTTGDITGDPEAPPGDPCQEPGGCAPPPEPPKPPEPPAVPPPPAAAKIHTVAPQILSGLRVKGETAIHPPREVFHLMHRNGDLSTTASIKVCLTATGAVGAVAMLKSSKYDAYDDAILAAARRWVYQPYKVNGSPVPACSVVTFRYEMK